MFAVVSRLYLAILACAWAIVVTGIHQALFYEKADGYPPMIESLGLAGLLSSPFVLGAIFLTGASLKARVMRVFAALAIFALLYGMLFVAWMWDIRMIVDHVVSGTFMNTFFVTFVLGPPVLIATAAGVLVAHEVRFLRRCG